MRYDDVSQAAPEATTLARADVDSLPPGVSGPATGNTITGAGTITGQAGADSIGNAPGHIVAVEGAGGASAGSNGEFVVKGAYGILTIEADGSYSYVRNAGAPDGVDDVFKYTLADHDGRQSSSTLTIELGVQPPSEAATAALQGVPGVISLPAGVEVSDIHVVGRDLVIDLPDGTHMTIPGGAVFVPQLVIGDVELPPSNLAALLIDSEPKPAAGPPQSSGGNFAVDVPPLDPGVPLGDLLPPTELAFQPPEFQPVNGIINHIPTVVIETPDNPAGAVNASESVFEKGLPIRGSEPAGSGEIADGNGSNNSDATETNTGTIVYTAQDGLGSITVNGVAITGIGQVIHGQFGDMTITSIASGAIGYSYTLLDNTSGDNTADNFTVVVTDSDGDTATGSLTVHIVDDVPTAHNDTDALVGQATSTDGNVMTGAGTTSGSSGADVVGADNATVTGAHAGTSGGFASVPQNGAAVTIHGSLGDLVLHDDGSYTYTRSDPHAGGTDVFTYQLTDGDGDTSTATLTITVPQINQSPSAEGSSANVSEEGLVGGNPDTIGSPDTTNSATASGSITASDPDGDSLTMTLGAPAGSFTSGGQTVNWSVSSDGHTLTGYTGADSSANHVIEITIANDGTYHVDLIQPFDDPNPNIEDSIAFDVPVNVSDGHGASTDVAITVTVEDDSPTIALADVSTPNLTVDETDLSTNASAGFAGVFTSSFGADGAGTITYALGISASGADSGLIDTASGNHVFLFLESGQVVGREGTNAGTAAAGPIVFTVSIDSSGTVTLDQVRAVVHPNTSDPNDNVTLSSDGLMTVTATITDKDGDHQSASADIGQNLNFHDDGPSIGTVQNQQASNDPSQTPAVGTLHFSAGADGAGSTMTITADNTGITSGGHALLTVQSGNVLTAYQDTNNDGIHQVGETTVVYTLTVDPTAGTSGQYTFNLVTPLDPTITEVAIGGSSSFGAGPALGQTLTDGASPTPHPLSVVSGYHPTASFDVTAWMSGTALSGTTVTSAGVNGSTAGWGVDNNNFNTNAGGTLASQEIMYFDFGSQALSDPDGPGAFNPPSVSLPNITYAKFDFISYKSGPGDAGDDIAYVVHFTDGSSTSGWVPDPNIDGATWQFSAPAGKFIADISFYSGLEPDGATQSLAPGKIDLVSVGTTSSTINQTPSFTVQLTDGDGDPTGTAAFSVHVADGLVPFAPAAPVVLDLNGDGVHFLAAADGVTYNYGDGTVATAWASPQDGILVHDANGNGTVDGASEFVFGGNGVSDLQALSAYDTNGDGKLTSADTAFASFGVWQDANSNGVVDAGEYQTLAARGITAISLTTDGVTYETANGDVTVVGTGSYTNANGTTGALADAIFATAAKAANDDLRTSTALSSNGLLVGAVAAAGLMSTESVGAQSHESNSPLATGLETAVGSVSANLAQVSANDDSHVQSISGETNVALSDVQQPQGGSHESGDTQSLTLDGADHGPANAPTELPQGTDTPSHSDSAPGQAIAAAAVAMPSAEQIAALATGGEGNGLVGDQHGQVDSAQHNQVVGKVLADSLAGGGGHESAIEAVLNSLPSHGGANSALEALASHGAANVPAWDAAGMASFASAHPVFTMETMMLHPDAPAAHS